MMRKATFQSPSEKTFQKVKQSMLGNFITEKKSKNIKFNTFQFKFHTIFYKKKVFFHQILKRRKFKLSETFCTASDFIFFISQLTIFCVSNISFLFLTMSVAARFIRLERNSLRVRMNNERIKTKQLEALI